MSGVGEDTPLGGLGEDTPFGGASKPDEAEADPYADETPQQRKARKMREGKARKKGKNKLNRHEHGNQKKSQSNSKEDAIRLGIDPRSHPEVVRAAARATHDPNPRGAATRKRPRTTKAELSEELDLEKSKSAKLERKVVQQEKTIQRLEMKVEDLQKEVKLCNETIGRIMTSNNGKWQEMTNMFLELSSDPETSDSAAANALSDVFQSKIRPLLRELGKEKKQLEKAQKEWEKDVASLNSQLNSAKDKVHKEKVLRRQMMQDQVNKHKSAIEDLRCHITDLELMCDHEKRLKNDARKRARQAGQQAQCHKERSAARQSQLDEEKAKNKDLADRLRDEQKLNASKDAILKKMEENLRNRVARKKLEKTFEGRGGAKWKNWVVLLVCELLVCALCIKDEDQVESVLGTIEGKGAKMEAVKDNFRMRWIGLGLDQFQQVRIFNIGFEKLLLTTLCDSLGP